MRDEIASVERVLLERTDLSIPHIHVVAKAIMEALPQIFSLEVTYEDDEDFDLRYSTHRATSAVIEVLWQGERWRFTTPAGDSMVLMERL